MTSYPDDFINKVICGYCLDVMREIPDNVIDAVVTDPPYGIKFMGKKWDYKVPSVEVWEEVLRVLKPGGYMLCACGTRTQHRMVCNIEDAGFEARDIIAWLYGSGFPKSLDVGKAIDKELGAERKVVGEKIYGDGKPCHFVSEEAMVASAGKSQSGCTTHNKQTEPVTHEAKQWEGYGTALKPAMELFTLCRKPLSEKNVAKNVLKWGTGGIDIDGCRIPTEDTLSFGSRELGDGIKYGKCKPTTEGNQNPQGRFPANVIHDGSEEVVGLFPETKSGKMKQTINGGSFNGYGKQNKRDVETIGDKGSAARFFYTAKASKSERGKGNNHPTVKPLALMEYLVKLITPKDGIVLDPYCGSGTTGVACKNLGRSFILIEKEQEYCAISEKRLSTVHRFLGFIT